MVRDEVAEEPTQGAMPVEEATGTSDPTVRFIQAIFPSPAS